jgi:hypothetical protein
MTFGIDKMEALAKAAPSGKWEVWTSNSWRRVYAGNTPVITPCVQRHDHHPDLMFGPGVVAWLEGVTPDVVRELIAEVRAWRNEAVAHQAFVDAFNASTDSEETYGIWESAIAASLSYKQAAIDAARGAK